MARPARTNSWLNMHVSKYLTKSTWILDMDQLHFGEWFCFLSGITDFDILCLLLNDSKTIFPTCNINCPKIVANSCPTIFGKGIQIMFQIFKIYVMKEKKDPSPHFICVKMWLDPLACFVTIIVHLQSTLNFWAIEFVEVSITRGL